MNNLFSQSEELKAVLKTIVKDIVRQETRPCFRVYKAQVVTAPYNDADKNSVCDVKLIGDSDSITIPYSSKMASMQVNDFVWVATIFDSFRNAIVWETIDFN